MPELQSIEDIDYSFLKRFEAYLLQTLAINTVSIILRNIRAVFNEAIKEKIISKDLYPFETFHIKNEETRKRSLSVEKLIYIRDKPLQSQLARHRDIFMLMFYFIGINIKDLCSPLIQINNRRIEYRRGKTKKLYSIRIEPEADKILKHHKKGKQHLFNFLDNYKNTETYKGIINRNLKKLHPKLSTNWARHTWATIAAELDIPKETIGAALGHKGNSVTDIYIQFNQKKIDEANRKIIDYVNLKESKNDERKKSKNGKNKN
jgi:site-specific recombinase XerD